MKKINISYFYGEKTGNFTGENLVILPVINLFFRRSFVPGKF